MLVLLLNFNVIPDFLYFYFIYKFRIASSVTLEIFERTMMPQSIDEIVKAAPDNMKHKLNYNVHKLDKLGSISSSFIRSLSLPIFSINCFGLFRLQVNEIKGILNVKFLRPISDNSLAITSVEGLVGRNDLIHGDVLNYIKSNKLYFYSTENSQRRNRYRIMIIGASTVVISAGIGIMFWSKQGTLNLGTARFENLKINTISRFFFR